MAKNSPNQLIVRGVPILAKINKKNTKKIIYKWRKFLKEIKILLWKLKKTFLIIDLIIKKQIKIYRNIIWQIKKVKKVKMLKNYKKK